MSKEFEQALDAAKKSLPTMSQGFMSTQSCYEARELHMFRAGRALGRREMKGECKAVAAGMPVPDFGNDMKYDGYHQATDDIAAAIEAIPEEVCGCGGEMQRTVAGHAWTPKKWTV